MDPKKAAGQPAREGEVFKVQEGTKPARSPAAPSPSGERARRRPSISYYRRMRRGRLFPLSVRLDAEGGSRDDGGASVIIAPVVAGALVTPSVAELPSRIGSEARFQVLPLAKGKLPEARVEFRSGGRTLGQAPLAMKAVAGRGWFFRILVLLLIALPLLLYYMRRHQDFLEFEFVTAGAKPIKGSIALDKWLEKLEADLQTQAAWDTRDWLAAAAVFAGPALQQGYSGLDMVRNIDMAEVYLFAALLVLTLLAWYLGGPARARTRGSVLEFGG